MFFSTRKMHKIKWRETSMLNCINLIPFISKKSKFLQSCFSWRNLGVYSGFGSPRHLFLCLYFHHWLTRRQSISSTSVLLQHNNCCVLDSGSATFNECPIFFFLRFLEEKLFHNKCKTSFFALSFPAVTAEYYN